MILAMFVDAGRTDLLTALAGGPVYVPPSIMDPHELPPYARSPLAEFGRGLYFAQRRVTDPLQAARLQRRTAFYRAIYTQWKPAALSVAELRQANELTASETRAAARAVDPTFRIKRVSRGEAEAAAVAITRGWTLLSDDAAIVQLVRALYPAVRVERLCGLLIRAVASDLLPCQKAARLYNDVFSRELGLWTSLSLTCENDQAVCR